ncbi:hypothetical protein CBER1_03186 [Cercospora berteroae]|uniref:Uncharacterized protein n=1 Tax=Cercospora berteroae TaxID=357750 RepID=A0A2S6CL87_9PEZI|nr:hypothetical protein CBER1_03186 [Cercospora berteroae]
MAEFLLKRGANVDARDDYGRTALFQCCALDQRVIKGEKAESLNVIQFLLGHGASIDAEDNQNSTALCAAAAGGMLPVIEKLLQAGALVNGAPKENAPTPLLAACVHSTVSTPDFIAGMTMLLRHGADTNLSRRYCSIWMKSRPSMTALAMIFLCHRSDECVSRAFSLLLYYGADVNLGDEVPLEHAIFSRSLDMVKLLLDSGANTSLLSTQCMEVLQNASGTIYDGVVAAGYGRMQREKKWTLIQQYLHYRSGDSEGRGWNTEGHTNETSENDKADGNKNDTDNLVDLTMADGDSSSFYEESEEGEAQEGQHANESVIEIGKAVEGASPPRLALHEPI